MLLRGCQALRRSASSASAHVEIDRAGRGVDGDDVAVAHQRDRPAFRRLGADMADAEAARRAREAPVGDQRDFLAHALAVERGGGRQHLAHARAALGAFVADDDDRAFLDLARLDGREAIFLAFEHLRRAAELQPLHAGDLDDRAVGRQRAAQADDTAGRGDRRLHVVDHLLVGVPGDLVDILAERLAGDGHRLGIEEAAIEQRLHHHVDPAGVVHVLGDIFPAGLQVGDVRRRLEYFGDVEQVELDAALVRHRRQVQRAVGRAASRRDDAGGVLESGAGADVARADVALEQLHHLPARGDRHFLARLVRSRRHVAVRQG